MAPQHPDMITMAEFEKLLYDLATHQREIYIRLQVNGQPAPEHFFNVLVCSKHAAILTHMPTRTVASIRDLRQVTGFEIDQPYGSLRPFRHYMVSPLRELNKDRIDGLLHA